MASDRERRLRVAVCGPAPRAADVADAIEAQLDHALAGDDATPRPLVIAVAGAPDHALAARFHLVAAPDRTGARWIDVAVGSDHDAAELAGQRLAPWAERWHLGRRAPRNLVAALAPSSESWPWAAERLIARLQLATSDLPVVRIDHVGSTSVPGLAAKDLIDIQIAVPTSADAAAVATAGTAAGFAHVHGDWFGLDRGGNQHREEVLVDADPGRPVNVNIRAVDLPVARDAVLFRDWLRATSAGRESYEAMKRDLIGRHVDDYGARKEPFISGALVEAEEWAASTDWTF